MIRFVTGAKALLAAAVAALAITAFVPSYAQELAPEHLALARKYVDLTDRASIYEVTLVETGVETMRQIVTQNPELLEPTNTAIGTVLETYRGEKGQLLDQFARVYAVRFTMDELQQIVAFYESPVGQKLATQNVEANQDLQRVMQVFEANLKREFYAKVRAELRAEGIEL